jgi:hypothetical protein
MHVPPRVGLTAIHIREPVDAGALVAMALANDVRPEGESAFDAIGGILEFDPPSRALLRKNHVKEFVALSTRLRRVFEKLTDKEVDGAAALLNDLLALHPAHPYLAKEDGTWRLHHHPSDAPLVPWAKATLIGSAAARPAIAHGSSSIRRRMARSGFVRRSVRAGRRWRGFGGGDDERQ